MIGQIDMHFRRKLFFRFSESTISMLMVIKCFLYMQVFKKELCIIKISILPKLLIKFNCLFLTTPVLLLKDSIFFKVSTTMFQKMLHVFSYLYLYLSCCSLAIETNIFHILHVTLPISFSTSLNMTHNVFIPDFLKNQLDCFLSLTYKNEHLHIFLGCHQSIEGLYQSICAFLFCKI